MRKDWLIRALFAAAAVYDGVLGVVFLFAGRQVFERFGVTEPNHFGYVQFPAALLVVFSLMFAAVAWNPRRNRNLILFGMLLKVSYCGVVLYYWLGAGVLGMWKPFCVADALFLAGFAWAWLSLRAKESKDVIEF